MPSYDSPDLGPLRINVPPLWFPGSYWSQDLAALPADAWGAAWLAQYGTLHLKADFGTIYGGAPWGMPYNVVNGTVPKVPVTFTGPLAAQADHGPYPIPAAPLIERWNGMTPLPGGDHHLCVWAYQEGRLYELYQPALAADGSWSASFGCVWDTTRDAYGQRPLGNTSTDAAGLPVMPGLVRYEEIARGFVDHMIRVSMGYTSNDYVWPASHHTYLSHEHANLPPMGARFRLKQSFDETKFPPQSQVILRGLKKYGMVTCDNGGWGYLCGAPDHRWNWTTDLIYLQKVQFSNFDIIETGPWQASPNN